VLRRHGFEDDTVAEGLKLGDGPLPLAIVSRGQHRGCCQGQDRDQWVAAPGAGPWVGDGGKVGEQVRGSASWSGLASRSGASPGIGDDESAGTGFHREHEALGTA
jgi:hypothetical protein